MKIDDVIRRVCESQPAVFLGDHQGYYRHADVSALVREIARLRGLADEGEEKSTDPAISA